MDADLNCVKELKDLYKGNDRVLVEQALLADRPGVEMSFWLAGGGSSVFEIPGFPKVKMFSTTLNEVLVKNKIPKIDVLTVDIEGMDEVVVKGLNFELYKPRVIVVEGPKKSSFLEDKGYCFWRFNGQDTFWIKKSDMEKYHPKNFWLEGQIFFHIHRD